MNLVVDSKGVFIFDLDDTLFKEIKYLESAFREIANYLITFTGIDYYSRMIAWQKMNLDVFSILEKKHWRDSVSKSILLEMYRNHLPKIEPDPDALKFIEKIRKPCTALGIITDGRASTQRNKINALNLNINNKNIIISEEYGSEKPAIDNYHYFEKKYPGSKYYYFGDNVEKDFFAPNHLGWVTVCILDNGKNIHPQIFGDAQEFLPQHQINSFSDIEVNYE